MSCSREIQDSIITTKRAPISTFANFRPSDGLGLLHTAGVAAITAVGLWMSRSGGVLWAGGQILVAVAFVQWFILLHECGHETLFRRASFNIVAGHIASFFSIIPFVCWKRVHGMHHRWTGWQDLDPTTASLVPRRLSAIEIQIVRISWKYWIPTFSVLYRINNYWNLARLRGVFGSGRPWRQMVSSAAVLLLMYGIAIYVLGVVQLAGMVGPALFASLVFEDPLILSQHTHIPQHVSNGNKIRPFAAQSQEEFTRSLRFPKWFSRFVLFHFDAHELHHMYPFVPAYHLRSIAYTGKNEIDWWQWLTIAKRIPGDAFLFQNQNDTGIRI